MKAQYIRSSKHTVKKGGQKNPLSKDPLSHTYLAVASELCVANNLVLRGSQLVIPPKLRTDILGTKESLNVNDVFHNLFGSQVLLKT